MAFFIKLILVFRLFQIFCSLVALGCGVYVAYVLLSMNSELNPLKSDIDTALSLSDLSFNDQSLIRGILGVITSFFNGVPIGAYILSGVSAWSSCVTTYLLVAQTASNNTRLNERGIAIPLEVFTAAAWVITLVSVTLLASKYSVVCLPYDLFLDKLQPLNTIFEKFPILNQVLPSCTLNIVAAAAAGLAFSLFYVTDLLGCSLDQHDNCYGSKPKRGKAHQEADLGDVSKSWKPEFAAAFQQAIYEQKSVLQVPLLQITPASQYDSPFLQGCTPVPQYASPRLKYRTSSKNPSRQYSHFLPLPDEVLGSG